MELSTKVRSRMKTLDMVMESKNGLMVANMLATGKTESNMAVESSIMLMVTYMKVKFLILMVNR